MSDPQSQASASRRDAPLLPDSNRRLVMWAAVLVVFVGGLAYSSSFGGVFLLDDARQITENSRVRELPPMTGPMSWGRRPVVTLSLAWNYAWSGEQPWSYHVVNLAVHLLAALTLLGVVRRTLLLEGIPDRLKRASLGIATISALLWVAHPLTTQAVTYVIQRAESTMALFYLLTIYCFVRGATSTRPWLWFGTSVLTGVLGMGCKAVMVTMPITILLYDRCFIAGSFRKAVRRHWPAYAGLAATWLVLFSIGIVKGVLKAPDGVHRQVGFSVDSVQWTEYALTQPAVILHYLRLSLWPYPLVFHYQWPPVESWLYALPAIFGLALLIAAGVFAWRRSPRIGFSLAAFLLILSPTSSFVPIHDLAFEHRVYLPLAALVPLFAVGLHELLDGHRRALTAVAAGLVLGLGVTTFRRNLDYQSAETMWRTVTARAPKNGMAWNSLGNELSRQERYDEAARALEKSVRLLPSYPETHYNFGRVQNRLEQYQAAIPSLERALALDKKYARAAHELGIARAKSGDPDGALTAFERAVKLEPDDASIRLDYGRLLARRQLYADAEIQYRAALDQKPDDAAALADLAVALAGQGRSKEAISTLKRAVAIEPRDIISLYNLGSLLAADGDRPGARKCFEKILTIEPDHAAARSQLRRLER